MGSRVAVDGVVVNSAHMVAAGGQRSRRDLLDRLYRRYMKAVSVVGAGAGR